MGKDWVEWHRAYDDPESSLSQRLAVVRDYLGRALADASGRTDGELRLISMCAGEGRDTLPVLAAHEAGPRVRALLVELDPELAGRASATAAELGLTAVTVRAADAGVAGAYAALIPAHVVMACGVFGNIPDHHIRRTIELLPGLMAAGGIVIWTRGRGDGPDPAVPVRAWFADSGFAELAFTSSAQAGFRVGMHRLGRPPAEPAPADQRMFAFQ